MIIQFLLGSAVAYLVWSVVCLELNVRKVRAMNVPIVRLPIDSNNVLWVILHSHVWSIVDRLPFDWSSYPDSIRFSRRGWHFADKSESHLRHGSVWALVSPASITLHFADPDAVLDIFSRRVEFVRPVKEYELLAVYGPCISTAGSHDWARHRKVLAAPFNEGVMNFVWEETLRQATSMLRSWAGAAEDGIPSMHKDTRTLSLNVLASTGFRKSYTFKGSADLDSAVCEAEDYRDALQTVLDNVIIMMLIPYRYLTGSMMPEKWVKIGNAAKTFKKYMMKMLDEETTALSQGKAGSGGIMTSFVRAGDLHAREAAASSNAKADNQRKGLSVDEIFGNLFIINFAGHDTTAGTLAFSMMLLAAHPEVQDWLAEEIIAVTGDMPAEEWDYKTLFPQLKRCRAVLLETLRMYSPIMSLPKRTSRQVQIKVGEQTLVIPPGVGTTLYVRALQMHPKYWSNSYTWMPKRWIVRPPQTSSSAEDILNEELYMPRKGIYFPWSDGPQNCPGRKFSEVEAVAVLACLFREHRLKVQKKAGESETDARKRAVDCTNNCNMDMLVKMEDPDSIRLVFQKVAK
ncbi:cytochrome P450 [Hypoxylon trugodes]|uniref:cytochrome P450 n=1 Tax=Hypoxylon trugodes TaxID=326681 RepID=UPI0021995652|nr:cytochrome P450 [Hypoxylon trugodes]KAI1386060.1 cytochrome P450 [Hypoxylon trugodes]